MQHILPYLKCIGVTSKSKLEFKYREKKERKDDFINYFRLNIYHLLL